MADVKISALGAIASVAGEDLVAIVDDPSGTPASRKATIDQIKTYIGGITTSSTDTFTNKSISLTTNTITGTSLELKTAISDETGSGALVFATSPTLVTPALGTPASGVATNITGLPLAGLVATTVSRALVSTAGGVISPATTTSAEIGYVNGVTSAIQTQMDLKSPLASPTFTGTVVLPNVPAIVTTQLDLKSTLASPTFTGTVVLPNVPAIVTTQLDLKSTLASPTFTGTVTTASLDVAGNNIDNIQNLVHDISVTTTALDFSADQLQTYGITSNITLTTANRAVGKSKTIRFNADASVRTITCPSEWHWFGTPPTSNVITMTASKMCIITMTCFGSPETDVMASFVLEE
tara:strand:- start:2960 stop:4015 length:1056 start_codon:yes stop_codon:yes gene_type:complete